MQLVLAAEARVEREPAHGDGAAAGREQERVPEAEAHGADVPRKVVADARRRAGLRAGRPDGEDEEKQKKEEEEEKKQKEEEAAAAKKKEEDAAAAAAKKKAEEEQEAAAKKKKKDEEDDAAAKQKAEEEEARSSARHAVPQAEGSNEQQQKPSSTTTTATSSSSSVPTRLRTLFVGCSYKQTPEAAKDIIGATACEASASTVSTAMATMQNVLGQDNFRSRQVLVDDQSFSVGKTGQPTYSEIASALEKIVTETKPGDAVVIFYAGSDAFGSSERAAATPCIVPSSAPVVAPDSSERLFSAETLRAYIARLPAGSRCTVLSSTPSGASLVECGHDWKQDEKLYKFVAQPNKKSGDFSSSSTALKAEVISISAAPVSSSMTLADAMAAAFSATATTTVKKFSEVFTRCRDTMVNAKDNAIFNVETSFVPSQGDAAEFSFLAAPVVAKVEKDDDDVEEM